MERLQPDARTDGVDLPEVDIAREDAVRDTVEAFHPDLIVNAAAYTDVERAETERDAAFRVNETGAACVARAAAQAGIPIVYYSTDYVFDGAKRTPYDPEDAPAPLCVYAQSKEAGERATRAATPQHWIIRTAWLYGLGGNHFVEKILRAAAARPILRVVEDEVGSPTFVDDLVEATAVLCGTGPYGVFHAVNSGACSRWEFAKAIVELAGLATTVESCASSEFPTVARRPSYSVLSNAKLEADTGHRMRPWRDALEDYLKRRRSYS